MKTFFLIILTILLVSQKPAYNQPTYHLQVEVPPLTQVLIYPYEIFAAIGDIINLDDHITVSRMYISESGFGHYYEDDTTYHRQWKFRKESQIQMIDNPRYKITSDGVFYVTVINEKGCVTIDSMALTLVTGTDGRSVRDNPYAVRVYPNPNTGTFELTISGCQPGLSVEIINPLGVTLFSKSLECNNHVYSETIAMPGSIPGIYYLLLKNTSRTVQSQKIVILKKS